MIVVGIPVKNEAERIGPCLQALARQRGAAIDAVILCLNNCTDGTDAAVRAITPRMPFAVHPIKVSLTGERACAGVARRIALQRAAALASAGGVLLTTDADGQPRPDWLAANLSALRRGADAVAGRAEIDPAGARLIPAHLHAADAEECAYAALLDEIAALIDPDSADPWPRHVEESGASIAVTVDAYRRAGGMPELRLGEDRGFFTALRRVDARIRHAPEPVVVVSARTTGRAAGGMADTMRRRMVLMDAMLDERLEDAQDAARRARLRVQVRRAWGSQALRSADVAALALRLGLTIGVLREVLSEGHFGAAWDDIEMLSPTLRKAHVPVSDLPRQVARAQAIRAGLRSRIIRPSANPDGIQVPAAAAQDAGRTAG